MIKLILTLFIGVQMMSFCAGAEEDVTARISNLVYYPHVGNFLFAPQFSFPLSNEKSTTKNSSPSGSRSIGFNQLNMNVQMGLLTDGLRLSLSDTELFHSESTAVNSSGVSSVTQASGPSDPILQVQYRFHRYSAKGCYGDAGIAMSPSVITYQAASTTQDGNNGRGYGTMTFNSTAFWFHENNEAAFTASLTHQFSGNGNGTTSANSYLRTATWTSTFSAYDRYHFTPDFFLQFQGDLNLPYSYSQTNFQAPPVTTQYHLPVYFVPHLDVGYLIEENFVVDAIVTYTNYTSSASSSSSVEFATANPETSVSVRLKIQI